jgi:hypothetical protein
MTRRTIAAKLLNLYPTPAYRWRRTDFPGIDAVDIGRGPDKSAGERAAPALGP